MNLKNFTLLAAGLLAVATSASALDGVVVANESVSTASLDASALKDIYTGKTMYWEGGAAVVIVVSGDDKADAPLDASTKSANTARKVRMAMRLPGP